MVTRRKRYRDGGRVLPDTSNSVTPRSEEDQAPTAISDPQSAPTFDDDESPVKAALDRIKHAEQLQAQMQAQHQQQQPATPQLSKWKLDFLGANPELVRDEEATSLTRYTYLAALRRGIQDDTPAMNEAILAGFKRMGEAVEDVSREPEREAPPVNMPPKRSVPISAPVARSAPSMAGGSVPLRITLSPDEVAMAHLSYRDMPKEKAERLYFEMKRKMLAAKAAGEIQS
jgi:hypothetical protein